MSGVINVIKMDMAICRKSMIIMMVSMLAAGAGCLFFLTPMLLGFFVVGSTAVVSAIFMVESKSNMEMGTYYWQKFNWFYYDSSYRNYKYYFYTNWNKVFLMPN